MPDKALDLFQAYGQNKLPAEGGYIVSTFFNKNSAYCKYEVVGYNGVKSIYLTSEGLTFQTDGNKIFVLIEPASYHKKFMEPVSRSSDESIPHRFSELEIFICKNQTKVMVSKDPIVTYSSFTIMKPAGINFSLVFYNLEDVLDTILFFFSQTLHKEAGVPTIDAKKSAQLVINALKKFGLW
ncbi:MAG: hypothetical protein E4H36_04670 [Spirochaetales bacterium]|nr:MAG: hypothetical protein E4H36_04670 [Spirochaetales bacterium]